MPVLDLLPPEERQRPRQRPQGRAGGYQRWSDLLFVHWRLPAGEVQCLLPSGLSVDTWEDDAWVGLVPFRMSGVRPWWFPPLPPFCETNLRTYVHRKGTGPGVWFFSLEASNSLAVRVARRRWKLNYFRAAMTLQCEVDTRAYASRRLWPPPAGAHTDIRAQIGRPIGEEEVDRPLAPGLAVPGTLEFFLAERYYLYTCDRGGALFRAQVNHPPYPLREATLLECEESLREAAGLPNSGDPCHALFCPGVSVEVFPLRKVP